MPRYIDGDALKETLLDIKAVGDGADPKYIQGMQDVVDGYFPQIIDDEPTADVEPVRHGQWTRDVPCFVQCSECKDQVLAADALFYSFCPNCGAKMDGGD